MFIYLSRKLNMLLQSGYTDTNSMKKVVNNQFSNYPEPVPEVLVTNNIFRCLKDNSLDVEFNDKQNKIFICKKLIRSEQSLKAAVEREKVWVQEKKRMKSSSDDEQARGVIQACKAEMNIFSQLDPVLREEAARICAKVHSKFKITNKLNRNVDTWHFYTRQLVEDNWYVY